MATNTFHFVLLLLLKWFSSDLCAAHRAPAGSIQPAKAAIDLPLIQLPCAALNQGRA